MIIARFGVVPPNLTGPQGACPANRSPFVSRREPLAVDPQPTAAALLGLGVVL